MELLRKKSLKQRKSNYWDYNLITKGTVKSRANAQVVPVLDKSVLFLRYTGQEYTK